MESFFKIVSEMIHYKEGFIPFSIYELGKNEEEAKAIFNGLKGNDNKDLNLPLQIRLVKSTDEYDKILGVKSCTLDEYTQNCKRITKDVFRITNLI